VVTRTEVAPYSGVLVLMPRFTLIVATNNKRICSIRVCNDTYKLLFINVYMPYESDADAADESNSVMADLIAIIDQFNDHCFVIGGDFNVDFNKHEVHSTLLREMCDENGICIPCMIDVL
jgi:exonuclease III